MNRRSFMKAGIAGIGGMAFSSGIVNAFGEQQETITGPFSSVGTHNELVWDGDQWWGAHQQTDAATVHRANDDFARNRCSLVG